MKLYQFFTGFFPEFHFCPTGDFDFPAGFHRSPAVISTSERVIVECLHSLQVGSHTFNLYCWYCTSWILLGIHVYFR